MITSSTNTKDFRPVESDPQFRVDSPHTNPFLAAAALNVTQSFNGPNVEIAPFETSVAIPSVESILDEVTASCRRDVELHPNSSRAHTNLAIAYLKRARYQEAIRHLDIALSLNACDYVALHTLALARINTGDFEGANNIYKEIIKIYPADSAALISSANVEIRRGNFPQAETLLTEAVHVDKHSIPAKYQLAIVLLKLGKVHQSIGLLRKAVVDDSRSADLYQALAVAYLVAQDFKHADRAFKGALALNRSMAPALHGLAQLKLQQGDFEEAIALLSDHLTDTDDDTAREILANAFVRNEQYGRARLQLMHLFSQYQKENVATPAEIARISNNIGYCFSWERMHSDAEVWLKRSLEFSSTSSVVPYNNLAQIYLGQDRPKAALQVLEQGRHSFPNDTRRRLLTEAALIRAGHIEEAIDELQSLLNGDDAPVEAYIDLGWILVDLRDDKENALAVLRSGFARYPSNPLLANNFAYAYLMRGEPQYARSILDSLPETDDHVHLIATRGLLRLWEGALDDAEALYKKAEQLASQLGDPDLARVVRQKKHLEFARAYLRLGRNEEAMQSITAGLGVPRSKQPYKYQKDLEALKKQLTTGEQMPQ